MIRSVGDHSEMVDRRVWLVSKVSVYTVVTLVCPSHLVFYFVDCFPHCSSTPWQCHPHSAPFSQHTDPHFFNSHGGPYSHTDGTFLVVLVSVSSGWLVFKWL